MGNEGTEVRRALDGPQIDHDHLIGRIGKWNSEDRGRTSTAAETRGEIGQFTEQTGINAKALSWLRSIMKVAVRDGGQAKAMDIIRSLEKALPMIKAEVAGQAELPGLEDPVEPAEPGKPSYEAEADFDNLGVVHADEEIAGEADDFEAALAQVAEAAE